MSTDNKKMLRLTPKQAKFVEEYLRLQNGIDAYLSAYGCKMTRRDACKEAALLLRKENVLQAVGEGRERLRLLNPGSTIEELAEQWTEEIRFDIGELVDPVAGGFCTPDTLPEKVRRIVQGVEVYEKVIESEDGPAVLERRIKYKIPDRQKAKIELGKRLGFYPAERMELSLSQEVLAILNALTPESRDGVMRELRRQMKEK